MKKIIKFLESKKTYKKVHKIINKALKEAGNNGIISEQVEVPLTGDPLSMYNQQFLDNKLGGDKELFLCGGVVANVLYHLYHKTEKPIINDVDFFIMESAFNLSQEPKGSGFKSHLSLKTDDLFSLFDATHNTIDKDGYDFVYQQEGGHRYHMIDERKDKLINWVGVSVENYDNNGVFGANKPNGSTPKTNKEVILGGFDLNCTQAGLDISEGKIIYEEGFVEFLKTKQMIVTAPHTPMQTLIRLHKKVEELGCYCDMELESRFLLGAFFCDGVKQTIGDVTYEKYLKYKDTLDEYVTLVKVSTKQIKEVLNISESKIEEQHIGKFCRDFLGFTRYHDYKHEGEDIDDLIEEEGLDVKNLWMCLPKRKIELKPMSSNRELRNYKAYFNLMNRGVRNIHKEKLGWFMNELKETDIHGYNISRTLYKQEILKELGLTLGFTSVTPINDEDPLVYTLKEYGLTFISSDFTKEHVDHVIKFVKQHTRVWYKLPKKDFQYCYGEIKKLISYAKKEGDWVIGEFENYQYENGVNRPMWRTQVRELKPYDFDDFKLIVEKKKKEMLEPLIEPISLEGFDYIDNVTELVTPLTLKNEGKTMGHCVGGYSNTIKEGGSRIFHVEFDGISSTLQIKKGMRIWPYLGDSSDKEKIKEWEENTKAKWEISQHYGEYPIQRGNVTPNTKNTEIAKELCKFLYYRYSLTEKYLKVEEEVEEVVSV
jgi:hypothetical protein